MGEEYPGIRNADCVNTAWAQAHWTFYNSDLILYGGVVYSWLTW